MNNVELIGIAATVFLLISMILKDMLWLRILNTVGSAIFVVYGFLLPAYSTAIMNIIVIFINIVYIILIAKERKNKPKTALIDENDELLDKDQTKTDNAKNLSEDNK